MAEVIFKTSINMNKRITKVVRIAGHLIRQLGQIEKIIRPNAQSDVKVDDNSYGPCLLT